MTDGPRRLNRDLLNDQLAKAAAHPRRRVNLDLHGGHDALVHRFIISMQPDSYVRPHRHLQPHKMEMAVWLDGVLEWLFFSEEGAVIERVPLGAANGVWSVEVPPYAYHSVLAHTPASFLEVKQGPYDAQTDKDWAPWAPPEFSAESASYLEWMRQAR